MSDTKSPMQELNTKQYYETVDVAELPEVDGIYMTKWKGVPAWTEKEFKDGKWQTRFDWTGLLISWLRPVSLLELIREVAGKSWDACHKHIEEIQKHPFGRATGLGRGYINPDKETYVNNLKTQTNEQ